MDVFADNSKELFKEAQIAADKLERWMSPSNEFPLFQKQVSAATNNVLGSLTLMRDSINRIDAILCLILALNTAWSEDDFRKYVGTEVMSSIEKATRLVSIILITLAEFE